MNVNNVKGSEFFVLIFFYIFIFSSLSIDNGKVSLYSDNPEETDVVQVFEVPAPQIEKACPWKFAVKRKVCLPLDNRWSEKELGPNRLMTLIIQADDAKSINLGITKYELPEKVKLFLFDKNGVPSKGPFTNKHRTVKGEFWTPIVEGEILYVKLFIPKEISNDQISFEIGSINCAYHNTSTVCGINAPREGHKWRAQARSVAWYHVEGIYVGSGVLLNNTDSDFKPYFLSANHCRITEDNVSSMVIYWNYESPEPGIRNGGKLERFQFGATLCARDDRDPEACDNEGSDFVLVKLNEKPKPEWNVYYSGWDARGEIPKSKVFGIHHPRTIEKAMCIALEEQVISTRFNWDNEDSEGKFWRIEE
ncbi:MAG: hypothetical protein GY816_13120, partial [Cytophagales bacterium]|nr:hypothetical protein [Cytophagales bacterium]